MKSKFDFLTKKKIMKRNNNTKFQWITVLSMVFGLFFLNSSNAQSDRLISGKKKSLISIHGNCKKLPMNPAKKFVGFIKDELGEPMIGATVLLQDEKGTTTGINGRYELEIPKDYQSFELTFSYLGYETQIINFEKNKLYNNSITDVQLEMANNILTEVLILGEATNSRVTGCIYWGNVTVLAEETTVPFSDEISKSEKENKTTVEIFPNPFVEQVVFKFDVPKKNIYLLQVFDTKGQLLWSKSFSWYEGIQKEELSFSQLNLPSGNYFLRVIGDGRHIHTSKMIKIMPN